jgi:hypothetical protein
MHRLTTVLATAVDSSRLFLPVVLLLWASAAWSEVATPVAKVAFENGVPAEIGEPNDGRMTQKPSVQELDKDQFQIGSIKLDKRKRLITVPGRMIPYEEGKPIEFVATMKQGYKAYESVLMLDANAFEFNLACILIGLDPDKASAAKFHFDPDPIEGDRLSIRVGWQENDQWIEKDLAELVRVGEEKPATPSVWIYTGSQFVDGDRYMAQMDGVIIGLIHDPASIIEHREGIGIGDWGSIAIDSDAAPGGGQQILLRVQAID